MLVYHATCSSGSSAPSVREKVGAEVDFGHGGAYWPECRSLLSKPDIAVGPRLSRADIKPAAARVQQRGVKFFNSG